MHSLRLHLVRTLGELYYYFTKNCLSALNGTSPQDGDQASVQTQSQSSELATPSSLTSNSVSGAQSSPVPISPSLSTSSSSPSSDLSQAPSLTPTAPSEPSVLSSSVPPSKASSSQPIQSSSQAFVSPTPSIVSQSSSSAVSSRSRTSSPAASTPTPTTGPAEISTYLFTHNVVRAAHGASPLEWSENLSSVAQTWANRCEFRHSDGEVGPYGENLAAGAGNFPVQSAVKLFVDENCE